MWTKTSIAAALLICYESDAAGHWGKFTGAFFIDPAVSKTSDSVWLWVVLILYHLRFTQRLVQNVSEVAMLGRSQLINLMSCWGRSDWSGRQRILIFQPIWFLGIRLSKWHIFRIISSNPFAIIKQVHLVSYHCSWYTIDLLLLLLAWLSWHLLLTDLTVWIYRSFWHATIIIINRNAIFCYFDGGTACRFIHFDMVHNIFCLIFIHQILGTYLALLSR